MYRMCDGQFLQRLFENLSRSLFSEILKTFKANFFTELLYQMSETFHQLLSFKISFSSSSSKSGISNRHRCEDPVKNQTGNRWVKQQKAGNIEIFCRNYPLRASRDASSNEDERYKVFSVGQE